MNPKEVIVSFAFGLYILVRKRFTLFQCRVIVTSVALSSCRKMSVE